MHCACTHRPLNTLSSDGNATTGSFQETLSTSHLHRAGPVPDCVLESLHQALIDMNKDKR